MILCVCGRGWSFSCGGYGRWEGGCWFVVRGRLGGFIVASACSCSMLGCVGEGVDESVDECVQFSGECVF